MLLLNLRSGLDCVLYVRVQYRYSVLYVRVLNFLPCSVCVRSEAYKEALEVEERLMNEAIAEIDEYCERNAWMNEIYVFCNGWSEASAEEWRGSSGFLLEVSDVIRCSIWYCAKYE